MDGRSISLSPAARRDHAIPPLFLRLVEGMVSRVGEFGPTRSLFRISSHTKRNGNSPERAPPMRNVELLYRNAESFGPFGQTNAREPLTCAYEEVTAK